MNSVHTDSKGIPMNKQLIRPMALTALATGFILNSARAASAVATHEKREASEYSLAKSRKDGSDNQSVTLNEVTLAKDKQDQNKSDLTREKREAKDLLRETTSAHVPPQGGGRFKGGGWSIPRCPS